MVSPEDIARFWSHVSKSNGCWEWTGVVAITGYGAIRINHQLKNTHRLSWEIAHGEIPKGMCICHTCDNRKCVNPEHLFLGTRAENNRDMWHKGRGYIPRHEHANHPMAKLTEAQVKQIRKLYSENRHRGILAELGRRFGVTATNISYIVTGKHWR